MGASCGVLKQTTTGARQVILPLRKVVYNRLPTLSEMKRARIGPFFRLGDLDTSSSNFTEMQKWNRMAELNADLDFPLEAYIASPAARKTFQKRLEKGPPPQYRWQAWTAIRHLGDKIDEKAYEELPQMDGQTEDRMVNEMYFLYPTEAYFHESGSGATGQMALVRVLSKLIGKYPGVRYSFDLQCLTGFLLLVSGGNEVEVFYFLEDILIGEHLAGFFSKNCLYLQKCEFVFAECVRRHLPVLKDHMERRGVTNETWMQKWLLTLYTQALPLDLVLRIWDCFLSQGMKLIFKVGIAVLKTVQMNLLILDRKEIELFFGTMHEMRFDSEALIRQAFKVGLNVRLISKLEAKFKPDTTITTSLYHGREEAALPLIGPMRRSSSVIEIKPVETVDLVQSTPRKSMFHLVRKRPTEPFTARNPSRVPVLPKINHRSQIQFLSLDTNSVENEEYEDDPRPIAARDLLEELLQDEKSISLLSLNSISNLPPKQAPKVDDFIQFVDRLPM